MGNKGRRDVPRYDGRKYPIADGFMVGRIESRGSECGLLHLNDRLA